MDTEKAIRDAIALGEANKEVLELLRNWCANLEVERSPFGGIGVVEAETGLPIGMRQLRCRFMKEPSSGSMNLRGLALAFHDTNCAGCSDRKPVGFPNLATLVGERDREREADARRREERDAVERRALAVRREARAARSASASEAARAVLSVLDSFDAEPTEELLQRVIGTLRAVRPRDAGVEASLLDLLEAGGSMRATLALDGLAELEADADVLTQAAASALSRRVAMRTASAKLAVSLTPDTPAGLVSQSLGGLISIATPPDFLGDATHPETAGWERAADLFPGLCNEHLRWCLRQNSHQVRHDAICALELLRERSPDLLVDLADPLCASLGLADDPTGNRSAAAAAEDALGSALRFDPRQVGPIVRQYLEASTGDYRLHLVRALLRTIDGIRQENWDPPNLEEAQRFALKEIIQEVARRRYDEAFRESARELEDHQLSAILTREDTNAILGIMLLLSQDLADLGRSHLDIRPPQASAPELFDQQQTIYWAMQHLATAVQGAGARDPKILDAICELLSTVPESAQQLRHNLITSAAGLAETPQGRAILLPFAYRHMLDRFAAHRTGGLLLYQALCEAEPEALPPLLHDTFITLLTDPTVVVHQQAARILRDRFYLPAHVEQRALLNIWQIVYSYDKHRTDDDFLSECIQVGVRLARHSSLLSPKTKNTIIGVLRRMNPNAAYAVIERHHRHLRDSEQFAALAVEILGNKALHTVHSEALTNLLHTLTGEELAPLAPQLAALSGTGRRLGVYATRVVIDALNRARSWHLAHQVAANASSALRGDAQDARLKAAMEQLSRSCQIEDAISRDDRSALESLLYLNAPPSSSDDKGVEISHSSHGAGRFLPRAGLTSHAASSFQPLRRSAIMALLACEREGSFTTTLPRLKEVAEGLDSLVVRLGQGEAAGSYRVFHQLVWVLTLLVEWQVAIRTAQIDADRWHRAAQLRANEVDLPRDSWGWDGLAATVLFARDVNSSAQVRELSGRLLRVALPLPLFTQRFDSEPKPMPRPSAADSAKKAPVVVVLSFRVGHEPLRDKHVVQPGVLNDLHVDAHISCWPDGATELVLEPLSVEPLGSYTMPSFRWSRPDAPTNPLHGFGRMVLILPQSMGANPLCFTYSGRLEGQVSHYVAVEGQRDVVVRSFDPHVTPATGYKQVDLKLQSLFDELRGYVGLGQDEIAAFVLVMTTLASKAGMALQDAIFLQCGSEVDFQREIRRHLRENPRIGARLQEHANASRGITDLSLDRVPIELKYDDHKNLTLDSAVHFSQQTSQYVAGSDQRLGVICVLDAHSHETAPGSVQNDIGLRVVEPPGGGIPLLLGVVLIRGKLARPSDLSS